jgi:hypothetical protein
MLEYNFVFKEAANHAYYCSGTTRQGASATFGVEVTHVGGSPTMTVEVQHKNRKDTSWTGTGWFTNITATGVHLKDVSGLKQQIRLAFSFAAGATGDFVALRLLAAMWRDS